MFYGYDYGYESDMLATPADAMREYAWNVGGEERFINRAWILTDYDVWVANPHYRGPKQPHPDSYEAEVDAEAAAEAEAVAAAEAAAIAAEWPDDIPF